MNPRIPVIAALVGFTILTAALVDEQETAQAERDDLRYKLEKAESRPFPTVTQRVRVTITPKPAPTVTVRVTERASRSNVRETATRFTSSGEVESPLTGWKARYWAQGQAWARTPKVRAVIMCESTDRVGAVSSTGKYHGLYQFDRQTWASYGGLELAPLASQATRAEQNYVAYRLYTGRGWTPWGCA